MSILKSLLGNFLTDMVHWLVQKQITILFFLSVLLASDRFNDELPISLTEEEKTRIHEIYTMGRDTDPPPTSIRNVAEYERMQGALIRYPFGISTSIIAEMSEDITNTQYMTIAQFLEI